MRWPPKRRTRTTPRPPADIVDVDQADTILIGILGDAADLTDTQIQRRLLEHDIRLDHARYLVEHRDNPIVAKRIAEILARPIGKTG